MSKYDSHPIYSLIPRQGEFTAWMRGLRAHRGLPDEATILGNAIGVLTVEAWHRIADALPERPAWVEPMLADTLLTVVMRYRGRGILPPPEVISFADRQTLIALHKALRKALNLTTKLSDFGLATQRIGANGETLRDILGASAATLGDRLDEPPAKASRKSDERRLLWEPLIAVWYSLNRDIRGGDGGALARFIETVQTECGGPPISPHTLGEVIDEMAATARGLAD